MVKGSSYGFVVTGTTAEGQLVARTSTGTGTSWLPTGPLGRASVASVSGATVAPGGTVVAIGATAASKISQQPVFLEAATDGTVRSVSLVWHRRGHHPRDEDQQHGRGGGLQIAVGSANGYPAVWRRTSARRLDPGLLARAGRGRPPPARADQRDARPSSAGSPWAHRDRWC